MARYYTDDAVNSGANITQHPTAAYAYDAGNPMVAYCPNDLAPNGFPVVGNGRTIYRYDGEGRPVQRREARQRSLSTMLRGHSRRSMSSQVLGQSGGQNT